MSAHLPSIKPVLRILVGLLFFEVILLIGVGYWLGWSVILGLILLSAIAGIGLLRIRHTTLSVTSLNQADFLQKNPPSFQHLGTIVSAVLLIFPGLLTDVLGLVLLIPRLRQRIVRWLTARWMLARSPFTTEPPFSSASRPSDTGQTVEGEYTREDDSSSL